MKTGKGFPILFSQIKMLYVFIFFRYFNYIQSFAMSVHLTQRKVHTSRISGNRILCQLMTLQAVYSYEN